MYHSQNQNEQELWRLFYEHPTQRLKERILAHYEPNVWRTAWRYTAAASKYGFETGDLYIAGSHGLCKAFERFDPTRGVKFGSFAYRWIAGEIKRMFRASPGLIRSPWRTARVYERGNGGMRLEFVSLDSLADYLPADPGIEHLVLRHKDLESAIKVLSDKEWSLLHRVYFQDATQTEIALEQNVTQHCIWARLQKILEKLRFEMELGGG